MFGTICFGGGLAGLWVWGLGLRVEGLGFRAKCLGCLGSGLLIGN